LIYILASYYYPYLQTRNKSLSLKYDTTYLLITVQIKLIIAVVAAFFTTKSLMIYHEILCSLFLFFIGFLSRKMKPCSLKIFNPIEMGAYLLTGWVNSFVLTESYT